MVTQNTNPFVLPGFGQEGDMAKNPMLASMEMMRKAWEGLATASGFDATQTVPGTSPEDIERRIADLRAVENWLRMNLSMLSSTIQALEVQRSTLATMQAFFATAGGAQQTDAAPSPLDVALGIKRGQGKAPSADTSGFFGAGASTSADAAQASSSPDAATSGADESSKTEQPSMPGADAMASATDATSAAMKSWWDMLQTQFDNLASATDAGMQRAEAVQEAATEAQKKAADAARSTAASMKETMETAAQTASGPGAKKAVAKKPAARKAAAKKSSAKKATAKKATAK